MNTTTQMKEKKEFNYPRSLKNEVLNGNTFVKIQKALGEIFNSSRGRSFDYEAWKYLEFRNERDPEKEPRMNIHRWM
jgi:hypothetical protein